MSWLQQLVLKLKSVGRRKGADGESTAAVGASPKARTSEAAEKAPVTTVVTEDVPGDAAPETAVEKPAPATEAVADEPAAVTEATPADDADTATEPAVEEPVVTESAVDAEPEAEPEPAVAALSEPEPAEEPEPVAAEPVADETPVAEPEPAAEAVPDAEPTPADEPAPVEAVPAANPAMSTLDDGGRTAELIAEGPYGPGSGKPTADGSAPSADFTVKAKVSSKLFHTQKSPYFTRTKADVWFKSEADAESAGFQAWDHKKRAAAKK